MLTRACLVIALISTAIVGPAPTAAADVTVTNGCVDSVPEPGTTAPVRICYTLFRPAATAQVPLIFHSHGWGGTRTRTAASFAGWLEAGFGVLSFDQRSFGESGGRAHIENPDFEGQDVIRLVDLVAGLDWVRQQAQGDPVIGAIGGSYGGGYQFVGAFTELRDTGRTRFDALAPEITWWDLKDSLAPAEVARSVWVSALWIAGLANVPNEIHQGVLYSIATGDWPDSLDTFFLKNGPAWHVSQGRRLDIPVLFGQGITDNLFNLNQGLKNFDNALTPSARQRSILVGYNGGHTLPSIFPAGVGVAGDPCSVQLGSPSFGHLSQRFMAKNLKGIDTGLTGFGQYHLATVANRCVTQNSLATNSSYAVGRIITPTALGLPISVKVASGPLSVSGTPRVSARVSSLLPEGRAFFALSVGTSPLDARIVQNNMLPWREPWSVLNAQRTIELPAVAVDVPAGQSLFLTVSPIADMFIAHGSRLPGILVLDGTTLTLHQNR